MVVSGPGIRPGMQFTQPASNVDVAPTLLGLAGVGAWATKMDGRSVAPLLIDPSDPAVPESTRVHIQSAGYGSVASEGHTNSTKVRTEAKKNGPWRTFHPIEFIALNNHTWFGHLIDDLVSNTYRALRFVGDPDYGDLLYAEFTSVEDWHYESPVHYELFNVTSDPHQLHNLYYSAPRSLVDSLQSRLLAHWKCAGVTCP